MYKYIFSFLLLFAPLLTSADLIPASSDPSFESLVGKFTQSIISPLITLLFGVALLLFIWALVKYITKVNDPKAQQEARQMIFWGIIILAVMVSVWGLVKVVQNTFFDSGDVNSALPTPRFD